MTFNACDIGEMRKQLMIKAPELSSEIELASDGAINLLYVALSYPAGEREAVITMLESVIEYRRKKGEYV